jgi:hypothetical protein
LNVRRYFFVLIAVGLSLSGCNRTPQSNEAVRAGIMDHLAKNSGLDMKSMTVEVSNVQYEGNTAKAQVAFRPKASPDAGMTMNYTLERRGDQWVVSRRADSTGHGGGAAPQTPPAQDGGALPPGHPPVGQPANPKK